MPGYNSSIPVERLKEMEDWAAKNLERGYVLNLADMQDRSNTIKAFLEGRREKR